MKFGLVYCSPRISIRRPNRILLSLRDAEKYSSDRLRGCNITLLYKGKFVSVQAMKAQAYMAVEV
jgi:hypothetical protein